MNPTTPIQDLDRVLEVLHPGGIVMAVAVLALTWLLADLVRRSAAGLAERNPASRLLLQQIGTLLRSGLWALGSTAALLLAVDLSPQALVALGGVVAVAGGFALKDVATSLLAGITILVDRPFQVGDRIRFDGLDGEVVAMGLRSVKMRTLDHNLVTIPNARLLSDVVSCGNAGELSMMVQLDFHIAAGEDLEAARQIVVDAITTSRYATLVHPWKVVISEVVLGEVVALRLRAKVYVLDLAYEKDLESDVTLKVARGFREAGIAPPTLRHHAA